MARDPSVRIVLPSCDAPPVIGRAIGSVLAQTHDLELIVVDGGSADRTPEVVGSFDDDRVRCRRKDEPEGGSTAWNRGVAGERSYSGLTRSQPTAQVASRDARSTVNVEDTNDAVAEPTVNLPRDDPASTNRFSEGA